MQVFRTQIDCDCSLKIVITESTHLKKMESEITLTKVVRNFELERVHLRIYSYGERETPC